MIGAGAGMGVDSGMPDFRGPQGFWKAYPPYEKLGMRFEDMANPHWFRKDPALGWGFYGHRRNLYRKTKPHAGFQILRDWAEHMNHGAFVYTSNVDGHFQRAGFPEDRVAEVHGAIDWMQCTRGCGIFPADAADIEIDEATMRAREPFPACPECGDLARPNILMFGDWDWDEARTKQQMRRLEVWLATLENIRMVVVECGAGIAIPTVRHFCERITKATDGRLIRLNVRDPEVPVGQIGLPMGAWEGLRAIDALLSSQRG